MARGEQSADLGEVAGGEGLLGLEDAGVLLDDVAGAPRGDRRPSAARPRRAAPASTSRSERPDGSRPRSRRPPGRTPPGAALYADVSSLRDEPLWQTTSAHVASGSGTGRHASERQSSRIAWSATPAADANWSITPGLDADVAVLGPLAGEGRRGVGRDRRRPARAAPAPPPSRAPPTTTARRPAARSRRGRRGTRAVGRPASAERPRGARDVVDPGPGRRPDRVEVERRRLAGLVERDRHPPVVGRRRPRAGSRARSRPA